MAACVNDYLRHELVSLGLCDNNPPPQMKAVNMVNIIIRRLNNSYFDVLHKTRRAQLKRKKILLSPE